MSHENFNTYTEVDPNSRFAISGDGEKVTITGLTLLETAYIYKDFGVDFFDGDFEHLFEVIDDTGVPLSNGHKPVHVLANTVEVHRDGGGFIANSLSCLMTAQLSGIQLIIAEVDGVSLESDTYNGAYNTPYFLKYSRDLSVGTYGTLYLKIYSDSARTILLDTLSLTLRSSIKKFRYYYPVSSWNLTAGISSDGYINQVDLGLETTIHPDPATAIATGVDPTVVIGDIVTHQYGAAKVVKSPDRIGRAVKTTDRIAHVIRPPSIPYKIIKR